MRILLLTFILLSATSAQADTMWGEDRDEQLRIGSAIVRHSVGTCDATTCENKTDCPDDYRGNLAKFFRQNILKLGMQKAAECDALYQYMKREKLRWAKKGRVIIEDTTGWARLKERIEE